MTLSPQALALFVGFSFVLGVLIGGITLLAVAMRWVKQAEGIGYER